MGRVQWTAPASDAFAAIILDRRQHVVFVAARRLRQKIMDRIYLLREFPDLGPRTSENENMRELIVPPYLISYRRIGETIFILDVFHARIARLDEDENDSES